MITNKRIGTAPCIGCNLFCNNLKLTGKADEADDGGLWYEVAPNQFCINCGEPWRWMHTPKPEDLIFNIASLTNQIQKENVWFQ